MLAAAAAGVVVVHHALADARLVLGATPEPTATTTPQGSWPAITGSAPRANPEVVSPGLKLAR